VDVEVPVEKPASGVAAAVHLQRDPGRLEDLRMVGQSHVVVGTDHHLPMTVDHDLGVPGLGDLLEVRVQPRRTGFPRRGECGALVE
jgi:hypothetical protein